MEEIIEEANIRDGIKIIGIIIGRLKEGIIIIEGILIDIIIIDRMEVILETIIENMNIEIIEDKIIDLIIIIIIMVDIGIIIRKLSIIMI
jgi:hypothetical protein